MQHFTRLKSVRIMKKFKQCCLGSKSCQQITLNKKWQIVFKLSILYQFNSFSFQLFSCTHVSDQKHCSVCKHVGIQLHVDSQILPTIHLQLLYLQRVWSPRSALSAVGVSDQPGRNQIRSSRDEPEPLDDSDVPACSLVTQPLFS